MKLPLQSSASDALREHAERLTNTTLLALFDADSERAAMLAREAAGLRLDFSRQRVDRETLSALLALAEAADLPGAVERLLKGEPVNNTERRPALHSLLRAREGNGLDALFAEVVETRARMQAIAAQLNAGQQGFTGRTLTDVVNIGIGGSDLGPRLVTEALAPYRGDLRVHYAANVDPADLGDLLQQLDPEQTLFIICSKSFRTEETRVNGQAARAWMLQAGARESDLEKHFLAVTTNLEAAADFGIPARNCLPMWDWVGGRYSVWSAIGLSCAVATDWDSFDAFLGGAAAMDEHVRTAAPADNLAMLASLLEIWNSHFLGAPTQVILPYSHRLKRLPDFLQQLTMESNGKRVATDGSTLPYPSAPIVWGSAGTIGQHSFHQLLHQGTQNCPADFILPLTTDTGASEQHARLVANGLAQSRAMMVGRSLEESKASLLARGLSEAEAAELAPHLVIPGNRAHSVISMDAVTPASLGALLALYEHRTYLSGVLWGLNPFDQWGVELGKDIGVQILAGMQDDSGTADLDPATETLISAWRNANRGA